MDDPHTSPGPGRMVHIALPQDWEVACAAGEYTVSTRGVSLLEEGFIHCSFEHQVEATANRFYGDLEQLVVLSIDPSRVGSEIVVEPPFPGADEDFPHIYGPIPVAAVITATPWRRDGEEWRLPDRS